MYQENTADKISQLIVLGLVVLGLTMLYRYGPSLSDPHWTWLFPGNVIARFAISDVESIHDGFGACVCAPESYKKAANESDAERGGSQ